MAMDSTLSNIQRVGSVTPPIKIFNPLKSTSSFARINWIFGLYVGGLIAGTSYCLYNLYQAYQLRCHTSFGLDDQLKVIKCKALLDEAQEQENHPEKVQPLLQKCKSLVASIKTPSEDLLLQLIHCYAKSDPDHAYQIAQRLSSPDGLFQAAQSIQKKHPDFACDKLDYLFTQAFEAKTQEYLQPSQSKTSLIVLTSRLLEFAEAFYSVNNRSLESRCLRDALELTDGREHTLTRIRTLCHIAKYCHKTHDLEQMNSSIGSAQKLLREKMGSADLIQAHLVLAHTFFSIGKFEEMDQELGAAVKMFQENEVLLIGNIYSLKDLITKIEKKEGAVSTFKNFAIEPLVEKALEALRGALSEKLTIKERADAYLRIANIYQDKLINDPNAQEQALNLAFKEFQSLPESTNKEIEFKMDSLISFLYFYKQDLNTAQERMQIVEQLYDRILLDNKFGFGMHILEIYNKIGLKDQSERFFQKYLLDLQNGENEKAAQVFQLIAYASFGDHCLEKEQTKAQLAAAESLLSQLTSKYAFEKVAEGYLKVDRQKSLKLLENYENQQAKSYLIAATALPIIMGVVYVYPQVAPLLSLGFSAARLF